MVGWGVGAQKKSRPVPSVRRTEGFPGYEQLTTILPNLLIMSIVIQSPPTASPARSDAHIVHALERAFRAEVKVEDTLQLPGRIGVIAPVAVDFHLQVFGAILTRFNGTQDVRVAVGLTGDDLSQVVRDDILHSATEAFHCILRSALNPSKFHRANGIRALGACLLKISAVGSEGSDGLVDEVEPLVDGGRALGVWV